MKTFCLTILAFWATALASFAQDHPLVKPYEGSKQTSRLEKAFDEVELTVGVEKGKQKNQKLQGKITILEYSNPEKRSSLEVLRNYQDALKTAGFQILLACNMSAECGGAPNGNVGRRLFTREASDTRYFFAKLGRSQGDAYVSLCVTPGQ